MVNKQLYQLIEYARRMPYFDQLQRDDQVTLIRASLYELLIITVGYRSIAVSFNLKIIHIGNYSQTFDELYYLPSTWMPSTRIPTAPSTDDCPLDRPS